MNPVKCVFGVTKFLGLIVNRQGIQVDSGKQKAIMEMPRLKNVKQLKSFLGKVSYLRRFLPALAEVTHLLNELLKSNSPFDWNASNQKGFEGIKQILTTPSTMAHPRPNQPLLIYLTSTPRSIGALLAQEQDGQEHPIYYLSRVVTGPESRYTVIERHCLTLVFTAQKLRHYLLAYTVHLMTKCDPLKYLLARTVLVGKAARWFLTLSEYDIKCKTPNAIKSQALADLLAHFPSGECEPPTDYLPGDELQAAVYSTNTEEWLFNFDGSSAKTSGGAGIVLTSPEGREVTFSFKLTFSVSNNEAEYEALILGLLEALDRGITKICIRGDSNQIEESSETQQNQNHPSLCPVEDRSYHLQQLKTHFESY